MTVAAGVITHGNYFISCAGIRPFILFLHLLYTSAVRIMEFVSVCIEDIGAFVTDDIGSDGRPGCGKRFGGNGWLSRCESLGGCDRFFRRGKRIVVYNRDL